MVGEIGMNVRITIERAEGDFTIIDSDDIIEEQFSSLEAKGITDAEIRTVLTSNFACMVDTFLANKRIREVQK